MSVFLSLSFFQKTAPSYFKKPLLRYSSKLPPLPAAAAACLHLIASLLGRLATLAALNKLLLLPDYFTFSARLTASKGRRVHSGGGGGGGRGEQGRQRSRPQQEEVEGSDGRRSTDGTLETRHDMNWGR